MANIHLMIQVKGGSGKSTLCGFLAEYFMTKQRKMRCYDTDLGVGYFSQIAAFNTKKFNILDEDRKVDPILFDGLIEELLVAESEEEVLIDTGGDSHNPICAYITENDVFGLLHEQGHHVFIHSIVQGGRDYEVTTGCINTLVANYADAQCVQFVIWLNPANGKGVTYNGESFEDSKIYKAAVKTGKIYGVISLPKVDQQTFGVNIAQLLESKKTFHQGFDDAENFNVMARSRLLRMWNNIDAEISKANL